MREENYRFLKTYQELQLSIAYDTLTDLGFAIVGSSKLDSSVYWNNALIGQALSNNQIDRIEELFTDLKRSPTFCYENSSSLQALSNRLRARGYKESFEDNWLFWESRAKYNKKHGCCLGEKRSEG
jgi:hypothetical protein